VVEPIPNGVDIASFREAIPYSHDTLYVLVVSRLVYVKGVDLVLRAFARLTSGPEVSLLIAGDGPMRKSLESLSTSLGLEGRALFLGDVPHHKVRGLMAGCELLVLGSRQESFGLVLLEAMAAGKAVIAPAVGGVPEIVLNGETGVLVPPEDVDALSTGLSQLLHDRNRRQHLGANGQERVRACYSWTRLGERYESLYSQILMARRGECPC
jgi:glycosyltransferase involved in cell wall biosynthesis